MTPFPFFRQLDSMDCDPSNLRKKAKGSGHRAQSAEHRAQSTEHRAQSIEHRA